jgi:hypothetical protein
MLQNYNKILTKRTVFSIILELNPDQDLHQKKKKSAYFTHPDFSAAKIKKKSAQITRANTVHRKKCVKLVINKNYTEMHGQRNIKFCALSA